MNPITEAETSQTTQLLNPFLRYLALGWSVMPLQQGGKLPESRLLPTLPDETGTTKRTWKPYQTTAPTEEAVKKWWRNPSLNVGIVTGHVSGIVVLDLDSEEAIRSAYEQGLPQTPTATTGKGLHLYFKYPDAGIGNRANFARVEGFDLRGDGGYVVAPPSIHPSGKAYEWLIAPEDVAPGEMPPWLQRLLFGEAVSDSATGDFPKQERDKPNPLTEAEPTREKTTRMIRRELDRLAKARPGERNHSLNRCAFLLGQLVGAGLANEPEMRAQLEARAQQMGLPRAEARATIASGLRAGKRQPRLFFDDFESDSGDEEPNEADRKRENQTTALIRIGLQATLFHSPTGELYARYPSEHRHETHLISHPKSPFRLWLERQFYQESGMTPGQVALQQALWHLEQVAYYEGETRQVYTRIGHADGVVYLAIGDRQGHIVEIDATGWRLVQDAPVVFRSTRNAQPLPLPERGGSIEALRPLLNLPGEAAWKLCVGWIVGALNPKGPYAHFAISGEQGSGKSSLLRLLRAFVDPAKAEENTEPRNVDDFMVTCLNNHIVSYDNLSSLSDWLSDALCRLSTGAGLTKRMLYSDFDEVVIEAARPAILNGIVPMVTRPDLLERTMMLELPRIPPERRLPERHFEQALAEVAPRIFGAFLDAVVVALQRLPSVQLPTLPRMADFVLWVEAAAPALGWETGAFLAVFEGNEEAKEEAVLEADEVAETILAWAGYKLPTDGAILDTTMKQLLSELSALRLAGNDPTHLATIPRNAKLPPEWPEYPRGLLSRLARARPMLRKRGIEYERSVRLKQGQMYQFRRNGGEIM